VRLVLVSLALCSVPLPRPAAAQTDITPARIEITPTIGMYVPVGVLIKGDVANGGETRQQVAAGLIGFRIAAWPTRRLGLEGGVTFSPSQVAVSSSTGTTDVTGSVVLANARAVVALSPRAALWAFHVGAGAGVVRRAGSAWQTTFGGTAPALVLAFGARSRMRRSAVAMRLELEDYILFDQFDQGAPNQTGARVHHDITWSLGVTVPIF